ncbi:unnamed protein product [Urochloa humidicola]
MDVMSDDRSVRVTIEAQPSDAPEFLAARTPFEPQLSDSNNEASCSGAREVVDYDDDAAGGVVPAASGPERRLTLLALRLAVLEKAASGLGALGFIWATVVLLGGFAITLGRVDFWSVTAILLVEGARIFSRSHELEWQHQATWSLASAGRSSARLLARSFRLLVFRRTTSTKPPPPSPAANRRHRPWRWSWSWSWSHLSSHVGRLFYWLQLASALACVSLSAARLARQDFGDAVDARTNRRSALDIFYGLALAEALLFLAEKAAWEWEVTYGRLIERVAADCRLASAPSGLAAVRRFFYDAYSRCIEGSVFDGLRMDLVSFAEDLLVTGSRDEQRIGVGILAASVAAAPADSDTLRRVGTSTAVVERLLEMLTWSGTAELGARVAAARVVSSLTGRKRNAALRVAAVPDAVESVASLLHAAGDEECNLLGLLIVKKLARDHDNCSRIGNARGLLDKIIDFSAITGAGKSPSPVLVITASRAKAVQRSLQVMKMLTETTGSMGKQLRREVAQIVFTVSNIRDVLRHAPAGHVTLRRLAAEVLTRLAMDAEARERIGATGGVVGILLDMFLLHPGADVDAARAEAGEALAMLALESPRNCERILRAAGGGGNGNTVDRLVDALEDAAVGVGAGRILTNICAYSGGGGEWFPHLRSATRGATAAFRGVMAVSNEPKALEVSLGLAAQLVRLMGPGELAHHLHLAGGITEAGLVERLVAVLAAHACPSVRAPRIRRFAVELTIALLRTAPAMTTTAELMVAAGMREVLRRVAETTSELECFHVFSGSAGLSRHAVGLAALVDTALELMGAAEAEPPQVGLSVSQIASASALLLRTGKRAQQLDR